MAKSHDVDTKSSSFQNPGRWFQLMSKAFSRIVLIDRVFSPSFIFLAGSLWSLILVWWPNYLPMVDAPNHWARLHILTSPAASPLREMYTIVWAPIPDLGVDLIYMALHREISPDNTLRLCVSFSFILSLGAVWLIQRLIFGQLSYSVAAAPIFLFGSCWHMGYINFILGSSVTLVGLAVYLYAGRRLKFPVILALSVLAILALLCHLAAFAGFMLLLTGLHLSEEITDYRRSHWGRLVAKTIPLSAVFAPGLILYFLSEKPAHTYGIRYGIQKFKCFVSATLGAGNVIDALILVGLIVLLTAARSTSAVRIWTVGKVPLALLAIAILLLPCGIDNAIDVDSRLTGLLVLAFLSMTSVSPSVSRDHSIAIAASLAFLVIARMVSIMTGEIAYDRMITQFRLGATAIGIGKKVLIGQDTRTQADCGIAKEDLDSSDFPTHIASFATIDRDAFVPLIFTGKGMQPIRLTAAYANLGASASVPVPADILDIAMNPKLQKKLKEVLESNNIPTYFLMWPSKFDYVVMINHGCSRNIFPNILNIISKGDIFSIYRIKNM